MFDRTWSVVCQPNAGPISIPLDNIGLPGGDPPLELTAWQGSLQGSNVLIFDDSVDLAEASNRLARSARFDALMVVPRGGIGKVKVPGDMAQRLTVFFDSAFNGLQVVTVRIRSVG